MDQSGNRSNDYCSKMVFGMSITLPSWYNCMVRWMAKGNIIGVDSEGFAKHFSDTAEGLIDGKLTPEQVAPLVWVALPPDNKEGDDTKVSTQMEFKEKTKSNFRKKKRRT